MARSRSRSLSRRTRGKPEDDRWTPREDRRSDYSSKENDRDRLSRHERDRSRSRSRDRGGRRPDRKRPREDLSHHHAPSKRKDRNRETSTERRNRHEENRRQNLQRRDRKSPERRRPKAVNRDASDREEGGTATTAEALEGVKARRADAMGQMEEKGDPVARQSESSMPQEEDMGLDEESMMALFGGGVDREEEERLIAERKKKREEIELLHRLKLDEMKEEDNHRVEEKVAEGDGGQSEAEAILNGGRQESPAVQDKVKAPSPPLPEESAESPQKQQEFVIKSPPKRKTRWGPVKEESESEDETAGAEVTVHSKPLTAEEEEQGVDRAASEAGVGGRGDHMVIVGKEPPGTKEGSESSLRSGMGEVEQNGIMLDLFALSPTKTLGPLAGAKAGNKAGAAVFPSAAVTRQNRDDGENLEDNWDDHEGYYKTLIGELIHDRYQVLGSIGRGVFSTVLKCQDQRETKPVAIKLIRNNDIMRKAAGKELDFLREISIADPENRKHCVRLLDHFDHRNHVCMVFESMQMNLRETLRKFGKHVGINITAVRTYAKQLLVALKHIGTLGIVHADIKPDNILVSEGFSQLKICDFGSAFRETSSDNDPTPYLISRFYRAPEVILGFEYDRAVDLWSIGCCLYELFTGRVTFPGANNNEMLRLMMEIKGGISAKMIKRHRAAYERLQLDPLFELDGRYRSQEVDPVLKRSTLRLLHFVKPARDLCGVLMKAKAASDDKNLVQSLADLLEKIFSLDPTRRVSIKDALHHPFVSSSAAALSVGTAR